MYHPLMELFISDRRLFDRKAHVEIGLVGGAAWADVIELDHESLMPRFRSGVASIRFLLKTVSSAGNCC
jgi:hypothetical protein